MSWYSIVKLFPQNIPFGQSPLAISLYTNQEMEIMVPHPPGYSKTKFFPLYQPDIFTEETRKQLPFIPHPHLTQLLSVNRYILMHEIILFLWLVSQNSKVTHSGWSWWCLWLLMGGKTDLLLISRPFLRASLICSVSEYEIQTKLLTTLKCDII